MVGDEMAADETTAEKIDATRWKGGCFPDGC